MSGAVPSGAMPSLLFLMALVASTTLAFFWLIAPFLGAILWAVIAAVLFEPVNARLLRAMPQRRNGAAVLTLSLIFVVIVVPALLLGAALLHEGTAFYGRMTRGEIDLGRLLVEMQQHLPAWGRDWLADLHLADAHGLRATLGADVAGIARGLAAPLLGIGQSTFGFFLSLGVMLYLTFFLVRDGKALAEQVQSVIPLDRAHRAVLVSRFVMVIRATIKGSLIVAILQGTTGGLVFWALGIPGPLLWGCAMGVFSLFPAIGTGLIWVPVTLFLLATGAVAQGTILFLFGFFVISSVDNVVRPILVGHDARMPDFVVLVATLGGFELMGFNGFVIGPIIAAMFMALWGTCSSPES